MQVLALHLYVCNIIYMYMCLANNEAEDPGVASTLLPRWIAKDHFWALSELWGPIFQSKVRGMDSRQADQLPEKPLRHAEAGGFGPLTRCCVEQEVLIVIFVLLV